MRLLSTSTHLLKTYPDAAEAPPYAILSHTWGDDEILFNDVNVESVGDQKWKSRDAAQKILRSAKQARDDGFAYIWIDNICIDKNSSAELSEAINSMFTWYGLSQVCYAYLADVEGIRDLDSCKWLSRGWTLQELIAPSCVEFYDKQWCHLGSRRSLADKLESLTNIKESLLSESNQSHIEQSLASINIATKMSWASNRKTTRREDIAYCLMGIFGVNMPLLYGEGDKAFQRLQEEILKDTTDPTILAYEIEDASHFSLLAPHPRCFRHVLSAVSHDSPSVVRYNSQQVTFEALLCPVISDYNSSTPRFHAAILDCCFDRDVFSRAALHLECIDKERDVFIRHTHHRLYRTQEDAYTWKSGRERKEKIKEANELSPFDSFFPGILDIKQARRKIITISLLTLSSPETYTSPPVKFSLSAYSHDAVPYTIVNSMPRISYGIIDGVPSRNGDAAGIIAISPKEGHEIPELLRGAYCYITWGAMMGNPDEVWCKLWTVDAMDHACTLNLGMGVYHAKMGHRAVGDLLDATKYATWLKPRYHHDKKDEHPHDTLVVENRDYPKHIITASIRKRTFLEQSRLDLAVLVEMADTD